MVQSTNPQTVYIAGPMRGWPEYNMPRFRKAAEYFRARGYTVISPAELDECSQDMTWQSYMERDLPLVLKADVVCLLPWWFYSPGARLEAVVGLAAGKRFWFYDPDMFGDGHFNPEYACDHIQDVLKHTEPKTSPNWSEEVEALEAAESAPPCTCPKYDPVKVEIDEADDDLWETVTRFKEQVRKLLPRLDRMPPKWTVLDEAKSLVHGDRGQSYGHPKEDFHTTARLWNAYLGRRFGVSCLDAQDVAMLMILLKVSREAHRHKRDNLVDIAGYAETCQMVHEARN